MTHTIERVVPHEAPPTTPSSGTSTPRRPAPGRRPGGAWAAIALGSAAAVTLVVLTTTSDPAPQRIGPEIVPPQSPGQGVPPSADGAERHLADLAPARPADVPGSADGAERYLADPASGRPAGVPRSADGAERHLAGQQ